MTCLHSPILSHHSSIQSNILDTAHRKANKKQNRVVHTYAAFTEYTASLTSSSSNNKITPRLLQVKKVCEMQFDSLCICRPLLAQLVVNLMHPSMHAQCTCAGAQEVSDRNSNVAIYAKMFYTTLIPHSSPSFTEYVWLLDWRPDRSTVEGRGVPWQSDQAALVWQS